MDRKVTLFLEDLKEFSLKSVEWCNQISEEASNTIVSTIKILIEDTARVSQLSEESLKAVNELHESFIHGESASVDQNTNISVVHLITGLKALCREHDEVKTIISPILEALQFQDRMTQNLDNMMKMLSAWLDFREKIISQGFYSDENEKEFGAILYKLTTMQEERQLIKNFYPESEMPEVIAQASSELFF